MSSTYRASKAGRSIVDQAREKLGWKAQSPMWCIKANVSLSTLKRFRRGEWISEVYFIDICKAVDIDNWKEIVDQNPSLPCNTELHFFAYHNDIWVGREKLLLSLGEKLKSKCRLLIITGITGIGKTALAERLMVELEDTQYLENSPVRENFDDQEKSTSFTNFARLLLEKCSQIVDDLQEQRNPQFLLSQLVQYLQTTSRLIIIDSLERLLRGNEVEGWSEFEDEWFIRFFHAILSADNFQSRIILTSQDLPGQIQTIAYRYQNFWHCEPLNGLSEESRLKLFEKIGIDLGENHQNLAQLKRICQAYEGHPLALRLIAGEVMDKPFYGDFNAYWQKYGNEIEEIEKAIYEAKSGSITGGDDSWKLDRFTQVLRRGVRHRIEHTFIRLRRDFYWSYILLCAVSIYRLPVPQKWWLAQLKSCDTSEVEQMMAIDTLRDKYLLEDLIHDNQCMVRLHNLVRSVALDHLNNL